MALTFGHLVLAPQQLVDRQAARSQPKSLNPSHRHKGPNFIQCVAHNYIQQK